MRPTELIYFLFCFIITWTLLILVQKFFVVNHMSDRLQNFHLDSIKRNSIIRSQLHSSNGSNHHAVHTSKIEKELLLRKIIQPTVGTVKLRPIEYGVYTDDGQTRHAVVMIRMKMDNMLYNAFLNQPLFQCDRPEELIKHNMKFAVDYPKSAKTHFYYEGYFHALGNTSAAFWSRNPRSGQEFFKPSTTEFLRSFYESFRRINHHIFHEMKTKLYESALTRHPNDPINKDVCGLVSSWIHDNLHFTDLSVQIHYGSRIEKQQLFWHSDAENSLLHFGITVHGTRILHSKRAHVTDGVATEILEVQTPGDVYVSSSALMNHAPEYPLSTWNETRIIAIQARFIYSTSQLKYLRQIKTSESWKALSTIIADILSRADLKLPTLPYIESVRMELSKKLSM